MEVWEHNETTPLLNSQPYCQSNGVHLETVPTSQRAREAFLSRLLPQWSSLQWRVIGFGALLLLSINFGAFMSQAPQLQIFENIICSGYIQSINSTELHGMGVKTLVNGNATLYDSICKSPAVQKELALVTGWKNTFDSLPSVALAVPYGILADKIGRRPVLIMSLASLACSELWTRVVCWFNLPLRLTWLAGLFQVPGGGQLVAVTMLVTIIADTFSAEERGPAMFRLTAMGVLAEVIATPISAMMLESDPWRPYMLGTLILVLGAGLVLCMPETLNRQNIDDTSEDATEPCRVESETATESCPLKGATFTEYVVSKAQDLISSSEFLWSIPGVWVCILATFAGSLDNSAFFLLLQYVATKFHWSIAEASYLISIRGCMTLLTLLVLLPSLSSFLSRFLRYDATTKDLCIARLSAASGTVGYLVVSLASSTVALIFGSLFMSFSVPFISSIMSVAATFVPAQTQVATLYSAMSVSRTIGSVVAGPIFASLYGIGLQLGTQWLGLPYMASSIIFFLTLVLILCIRARVPMTECV